MTWPACAAMDLLDNNVLVYAHRADLSAHRPAKDWLEKRLREGGEIALFPSMEAGFLRLVTGARPFKPPTELAEALGFLECLLAHPTVRIASWTPAA